MENNRLKKRDRMSVVIAIFCIVCVVLNLCLLKKFETIIPNIVCSILGMCSIMGILFSESKKMKILSGIECVLSVVLLLIVLGSASCSNIYWNHKYCAATCVKPSKCSRCGSIGEKALGHKWKEATCTEPKKCERKGCDATKGKPNGHTYGEWRILKAATLNDDGEKIQKCTECGDVLNTEIYSKEPLASKSGFNAGADEFIDFINKNMSSSYTFSRGEQGDSINGDTTYTYKMYLENEFYMSIILTMNSNGTVRAFLCGYSGLDNDSRAGVVASYIASLFDNSINKYKAATDLTSSGICNGKKLSIFYIPVNKTFSAGLCKPSNSKVEVNDFISATD